MHQQKPPEFESQPDPVLNTVIVMYLKCVKNPIKKFFLIHEDKVKEWLSQSSKKTGYQFVGYQFVGYQ